MASGTFCGNCPAEVADALTGILRESILLIRMAGSGGDADFCAAEANHIHNLPTMLRCYDRDKLRRYLAWVQISYAANFRAHFHCEPTMFLTHWQRLESFLAETGEVKTDK